MVAQVFSRSRVLQVPWLLLDRGNFAQCKGLWASPPPLGWAPLVGNRRPIRTLAYSRPLCPLLSKGGGGPWEDSPGPPARVKGRPQGRPLQRARVELKNRPRRGRAGLTNYTLLPAPTGPFLPEDSPTPHHSLWPLRLCVVGSSAQGKLQSGRTGRAARGQRAPSRKEPASPQSCLLSTPFVISVLVELVFGVLCFKVFVFVCFIFVLRGWGGSRAADQFVFIYFNILLNKAK